MNKNILNTLINVSLINRSIAFLVSISLLLLPFQEEMGHIMQRKYLGIFAYSASFYPLLIAVLLFGFLTVLKKISLPEEIAFKILLVFLIFILISGLFNIGSISRNNGYDTNGFKRFILTYAEFIFVSISIAVIYHAAKIKWGMNTFAAVRKILLYSFIVPGLYGIVQALYIAGFKGLLPVINYLNGPLHLFMIPAWLNTTLSGRLASVAGEPSYFAIYLGFLFPWIFSYMFIPGKKIYKLLSAFLAI
ncbi:MAG: hypothetical protein M1276_07545 [Deltaproteobacteria bacterium]|nr:hypothetical protein [Deltaproteobacteria bacterium]